MKIELNLFYFAVFIVGIAYAEIGDSTELDAECGQDEFKCIDNGRCINLSWRCDSDEDCHDGSDEQGCPATTCGDAFFKCSGDFGKCVSLRWTCDGHDDCKDGVASDESESFCKNKTCESEQFKCKKSGECIPHNLVCDGEHDCRHGEDEDNCKENIQCAEGEFKCTNGQCITNAWRCDQQKDCDDGSDETACNDEECTGIGERKCANGECMNDAWFCDGEKDCSDDSDEVNCTIASGPPDGSGACGEGQFQCSLPTANPECINMSWKCDGEEDCNLGSDEVGCPPRTCKPGEFKCDDEYCVNEDFLCDGDLDCEDGTDEQNCTKSSESMAGCSDNEFDCNDDGQTCISDALMCDGTPDCTNGKDESQDRCPDTTNDVCKINNGGCSQICKPHGTNGRVCECLKGYKLVNGSSTICEDIDECLVPGTCSQVCRNLKGDYKCECFADYTLTSQHYCKAFGAPRPELLLSMRSELRSYHLDTHNYFSVANGDQVSSPSALDFDHRNNKVFWTETDKKKVYSVDLKTKEVQTIIDKDLVSPDGLALDWIHQNLYIADAGDRMVIEVAKVDGTSRKTLISGNIQKPRALTVDPLSGWIYWTDWGAEAKIEKCGMNGKQRKVIVDKDIVWPNGLTIDYTTQRLFWTDAKLHHIKSSDLNGGDQRLIIKELMKLQHPYGITVFEDFVYWAEWLHESVFKTCKFGTHDHNCRVGKSKNGTEKVQDLVLKIKTPMDIHIYHKYRQPVPKIGESACGRNNGGCSHLCLPIPVEAGNMATRHVECACPDGMKLVDSSRCEGTPTLKPVIPAIASTTSKPAPATTKKTEEVEESTESKVTKTPNAPAVITTVATESGNDTATSDHSQLGVNQGESSSKGMVAGITIAIVALIAIAAGVIGFLFYKRHKMANTKSMNFDNPVYRKTTTTDDDQLIMKNDTNDQMQPLNMDPEIV